MTKNEIISECRDGSLPLLLLSCHSEVSEEFLKSQEPFWTHCTKHHLHRAFLGGFCCFWALWPCPPCPLHTHWEQHLSPAIPQLNPGTKRSLRPESNQSCSASMEKKNKKNPFFSNHATEPGLSLNPPACFSCSECLTSLFYHFQDCRWEKQPWDLGDLFWHIGLQDAALSTVPKHPRKVQEVRSQPVTDFRSMNSAEFSSISLEMLQPHSKSSFQSVPSSWLYQ